MHYRRYYPIARNMFAKAAELDPLFAAAYAGIADCDFLFVPDAKGPSHDRRPCWRTARRPSSSSPDLAAAHASRGLARWGAERAGRRLRANTRKALELDPEPIRGQLFLRTILPGDGAPDRAAELFERAAEVRPADYKSLGLLQSVYELLGRKEAAARLARRCVERAERELQSRPDNAIAAMHAAMALASLGEKTRCEAAPSAWPIDRTRRSLDAVQRGLYYSRLGETEASARPARESASAACLRQTRRGQEPIRI